jgi:hypothetical protein
MASKRSGCSTGWVMLNDSSSRTWQQGSRRAAGVGGQGGAGVWEGGREAGRQLVPAAGSGQHGSSGRDVGWLSRWRGKGGRAAGQQEWRWIGCQGGGGKGGRAAGQHGGRGGGRRHSHLLQRPHIIPADVRLGGEALAPHAGLHLGHRRLKVSHGDGQACRGHNNREGEGGGGQKPPPQSWSWRWPGLRGTADPPEGGGCQAAHAHGVGGGGNAAPPMHLLV